MTRSYLQEALDGTCERNTLLLVVLALIRLGEHLRSILNRYAPIRERSSDPPPDDLTQAPFSLAVLGLISLYLEFTDLMNGVENPEPEPSHSGPIPQLRALLR
jgi:hypothetical protein